MLLGVGLGIVHDFCVSGNLAVQMEDFVNSKSTFAAITLELGALSSLGES